jgi:hypothetical protein
MKHKCVVRKYEGRWGFICSDCPSTTIADDWADAIGLAREHFREQPARAPRKAPRFTGAATNRFIIRKPGPR